MSRRFGYDYDDCDCPPRREAERRGERDYEIRGYVSYGDRYDCPEANRAYLDGQRYAERQAEEAAYEREREQQRREEARAAAAAYESECYERAAQEQYDREMQADYEREMALQEAERNTDETRR